MTCEKRSFPSPRETPPPPGRGTPQSWFKSARSDTPSTSLASPWSCHLNQPWRQHQTGWRNCKSKPNSEKGYASLPLTKSASQVGESERLAAAGQQGAHSALFAATAFLLKRAQFPRYWPFPTQRGNGLSTGSADELEVGVIWLLKQDSNAGPV